MMKLMMIRTSWMLPGSEGILWTLNAFFGFSDSEGFQRSRMNLLGTMIILDEIVEYCSKVAGCG